MIQALPKPVTFDEFIAWYPEKSEHHIGNPKRPTFSVYQVIDGEYQVTQFRGDDRVVSPTFPDLNLTVQQVFQAGE